ncbi:hypothetical protein [Acidiphilium sp. 20-67-58]|uniref:hypothetical protein n=1 Tax=Acidiphilium sp. 20-67-58 TaxID=1970291 RepID=UPI0025B9ED61|nr:hypothetical protein [Acidiphilium sp. 20-67-58]
MEIKLYSWFDATVASNINTLTWNEGRKHKKEGELKQISKLFSSSYLRDMHAAMMSKAATAGKVAEAYLSVELGYIDKMPFAMSKVLSKKTELGDAIFFGFEETVTPTGSPISTGARAVLLQAKVTDQYRQICNPTVPIAPNIPGTSTFNELNLLNTWPIFDLYERSNSKICSLAGIDLSVGRSPPYSFAWYLAAPRLHSRLNSQIQLKWPSWWMLGAAIHRENCDIQFGDFLQAFLKGNQLNTSAGNLEVGASFNCGTGPSGPTTDWDKLCCKILKLVRKHPAPVSIFGSGIIRSASTSKIPLYHLPKTFFWPWPRFYYSVLNNTGGFFYEFTRNGSRMFQANFDQNGASRGTQCKIRPPRCSAESRSRDKKIPVIIVTSYRIEIKD